jgi:NADPH:quinone reductase-like Zn-dependent oxidoreductase
MAEQLIAWVEEGKIVPCKTTPYAFEQIADTHRALESGKTVGKLVLVNE